jgi:hypothetical protein
MMVCVLGWRHGVGVEQIFLSNFWQEFWRGKNFGKPVARDTSSHQPSQVAITHHDKK